MTHVRITRRSFLKASAAAAGTLGMPYIIPASVFSADVKPSEKIAIGYWGTGSQGSGHVRAFTGKADVQAVAVCDVNRGGDNYAGNRRAGREPNVKVVEDAYAAQKGLPAYKGVTGYNDFREFLRHKDLDAVVISLPDHWHALAAVAAAKAGLDMYSEKPMARSIHEAREMVKAVRRYGRVFQTGSQQRSDQRFRHACELARNGYIGRIKEVYAKVRGISKPCPFGGEPVPEGFDFEMWLGPAPAASYHPKRVSGSYDCFGSAWRSWREYSAGHITDWGAHHFDIAQWGMGMDGAGPVEITPGTGESAEGLTFRYANGIPLIKKQGPQQGDVQFIGDEGWVGVSRGGIWASSESLLSAKMKPNDTRLYESKDHRQDFLDCVRTRKRPICDVEIGCSSVTICLLGEIVTRLNRPLHWDHARGRFVDDQEADAMVKQPMRSPWVL
ncbi:MAG: Gfo/Idh/MocA family oxidoreductase [Phycisphaerae bacterium]|nr:Gfo/Idh/MocA family oxidoreductase [Phycisphaerae bacterium]